LVLQLFGNAASDLWTVIGTSLAVSGTATVIATVIGLPLGYVLGTGLFRGKRAVALLTILLVNTGMGLPPVAVGLVVYLLLSRTGPLGFMGLLFSQPAMIIAQVIIATPLVAGVTAASVASIPQEMRLQARSLGAGRLREAWVTLMETRKGVMAAIVAGFGGVMSEVGAVMMVGGNIQGSTRVMTTAIVLETRQGNFAEAGALVVVLIGIALVVNGALTALQMTGTRRVDV
jgi:tungstate transport system permease protein